MTERSEPSDARAVDGAIAMLRYLGCDAHAEVVERQRSDLFDAALSVEAVRLICKILTDQGVPVAGFIDDHVVNALVMRNQMQQQVEVLRAKLDEVWVVADPAGQDEKRKFMESVSEALAKYGHAQQAPGHQGEVRPLQEHVRRHVRDDGADHDERTRLSSDQDRGPQGQD